MTEHCPGYDQQRGKTHGEARTEAGKDSQIPRTPTRRGVDFFKQPAVKIERRLDAFPVECVDGDEPVWALMPSDEKDADEFLIDTALAETLIKEHLREWLLVRGWQVQTAVRRDVARWRLADCLAITEGGGDRLEIEAPHGDDELGILCESVVLLNSG